MKTPLTIRFIVLAAMLTIAPAVLAQAVATQEKTRDRLSTLLARVGPEVKIAFHPSSKSPFIFLGILKEGLKYSESLEVVISVTSKQTIGFRVFPHYNGAYINIDKVRSTTQLLRKLVQLNDSAFLFWGADETGDIFTGYTVTLESGFPDEAIMIVLSSIRNADDFIGEMRPLIDGSTAP